MKVKEESENSGLNLNIQKTNIMASSPITLWKIDGETMETMTEFIFLGSKITADRDCSHKIKRNSRKSSSRNSRNKSHNKLKHIRKQWYHFADKGMYS